MSPTITVQVEGIEDVLSRFDALPKEMNKASRRAIRKTIAQVRTQIAREAAQQVKVPVRVFKKFRSRGGLFKKSLGGKVWFGLNPIKASYLGRMSVWKRGKDPKAGKYSFPGAFLATVGGAHTSIFRRQAALTRHSEGRPKHWQPNLPIYEVEQEIGFLEDEIARNHPGVSQLFRKNLEQELNYEVNVRGNR